MENVKSDLIRGNIDTIILRCLHRGEMYGLEICNLIREASNGTFILKQPTLYSSLKRLEQRGMIASYWRDSAIGGRRHYYKLTDAGIASFKGKKDSWNDAKDVIDALVEGKSKSQSKEVEVNKASVKNQVSAMHSKAIPDLISPYNPFAESDDYLTLPIGINEIKANETKKTDKAKVEFNIAADFESTPLQPYLLNSEPENSVKPFSQSIQINNTLQERKDTVFSKYLAPGDCAVVNANREAAMTVKASKIAQYDVEITPFVKHYNDTAVTGGSTNYLLINKFQCIAALIVSSLLVAVLLIFWTSLKADYTIDEKNFFAAAYAAVGIYFLIYLSLYFNSPGLKKLSINSRREHFIRFGITAILIVAVFCINILVGLTSVTVDDYLVFLLIPSVLALAVCLEGIVQVFLRKSKLFAG